MRYTGLHLTFLLDPTFQNTHTVTLPTTIGRLPINGVALDQPGSGVYREHARIVWEENRPILHDLHSTNGTIIDGSPIDRCELQSGSSI